MLHHTKLSKLNYLKIIKIFFYYLNQNFTWHFLNRKHFFFLKIKLNYWNRPKGLFTYMHCLASTFTIFYVHNNYIIKFELVTYENVANHFYYYFFKKYLAQHFFLSVIIFLTVFSNWHPHPDINYLHDILVQNDARF